MRPFHINKSMFLDPRAVPVSAWLGHIPLAGWIVEAMRPRLLVELGTHLGASYFAFCQAVQENGLDTRCYAVDTWQGDEHAGHYGEEVFKSVVDHHRDHYEGFSKLMRMTFDEARGYFDDGSIDLLHIDGLHTYDAVRHDFEAWLPKMSRRGVVLLHDTTVRERDFGVWKLWSELRDRFPSFEFSHTHGLGVLLVGTDPPEALKAFIDAAAATKADEVNRLFERLGLLIATRKRLDDLARHQVHVEGDNGHLRGLLAERDAAFEHAQSAITRLQALLQGLESRAAALETELAQCRKTVGERDAALEQTHSATTRLQALLQGLEYRAAALETELAQSRRTLGERDAALAEIRHALDQRDAALSAATAGAVRDASERKRLQAENTALSDHLSATEAAKVVLESRVARLENELSQASASIAAQRDEAGRLARDLATTRADLSEILGSTCWRLIGPVRKLASLLRSERSGTGE